MEPRGEDACHDEFDIEVECLLEALWLRWGYDFRGYARASLRRRVARYLADAGLPRLTDLIHDMLRDEALARHLVHGLTINVTDMFRDPGFYRALREHVLPELGTHPYIKIWVAGCASGEEAYSIALLMDLAGLGERTIIYGTDLNTRVLEQARKGIYHQRSLEAARRNYAETGLPGHFTDHISMGYEHFMMDARLRKNIVFTQHDLVTDQVFGEMQLILCRNVLIYFRRELQHKVLALFYRSLDLGGFLGLGSRESLGQFPDKSQFRVIDEGMRVFQRADSTPPWTGVVQT